MRAEHRAVLSPDQTVRVAPRLIHRVIGDEVFVLMYDSRIHWLKNATARTLWERLVAAGEAGTTPRAIADALVAEFAVDEPLAVADTVAFLTTLVEKGLVDSTPPGT